MLQIVVGIIQIQVLVMITLTILDVNRSVAQNFFRIIFSTLMMEHHKINPFETGSLTADTWTKVTKTIIW